MCRMWVDIEPTTHAEGVRLGVSAGLYIHPHSAHSTSSFIEAYLSISPRFTLLRRQGK